MTGITLVVNCTANGGTFMAAVMSACCRVHERLVVGTQSISSAWGSTTDRARVQMDMFAYAPVCTGAERKKEKIGNKTKTGFVKMGATCEADSRTRL
jgi:hypothetical protein